MLSATWTKKNKPYTSHAKITWNLPAKSWKGKARIGWYMAMSPYSYGPI